ncbi:hypothetical protein BGZ68_002649 [Mortierella alpina]|nr:hypothetical protein BGZ68_002649 [Mortierella alpina]
MGFSRDILSAVLPWSVIECVSFTLATIIYEVEIVHFLFFNGKARPTSPRDSLDSVSFLPWPVPKTPRSWQGQFATWICGVIWFFSEFTLDLALILVSSEEDLQTMQAERLKRGKSRSEGTKKKRLSGNNGQVPYTDSQPTPREREQLSGSYEQVLSDAQQQDVVDSYQNKPVKPVKKVAAKDKTIGTQDLEAVSAETQHEKSSGLLHRTPQPPKEDADSALLHVDYPQSISEHAPPGSRAEAGTTPRMVDGPSSETVTDMTSESEATHAIQTRARSPRCRTKARKSPEPRPRLMVPLLKAVQLVQSPPGAAEQHHGHYPSGEQKSPSTSTGESSETSSNSGDHSETVGADKAKRKNKKKNKSKKRSKSSSPTSCSPDVCSNSNELCTVTTSAASPSHDGQTPGEQEMVAAMENGDVELAFAAFVSTLGHSQVKKGFTTAENSI